MAWHPDMARIIEAVQSAPSIFGQQTLGICWRARRGAAGGTVRRRGPGPGHDISPREVAINCGAALYNLRLAIRVAGREPSVWMLPGLDQGPRSSITWAPHASSSLPSRSCLTASTPPTAGIQELYEAMWLQHINPGEYAAAAGAASAAGGNGRTPPRRSTAGCGYCTRASRRRSCARRSAAGNWPAREMQLMTLSTDDDRPLDWLRAGQALQHALLTGTRYSMSSGTGRSERYRSSLKYRLSDFHPLHPPDRVPSGLRGDRVVPHPVPRTRGPGQGFRGDGRGRRSTTRCRKWCCRSVSRRWSGFPRRHFTGPSRRKRSDRGPVQDSSLCGITNIILNG